MATPRSNRRDFLRGKAAAIAVEQIIEEAVDQVQAASAEPLPPLEEERYLITLSRQAMACTFEFRLNAGQYADGTERAIEALDLVETLEDQLSVYRPHSEICRLNQLAANEPIAIERRFFGLIEKSVELWQLTRGAFDVTAGPLSELWGFKRRAGRLPDQAAIEDVLVRVGSQHLQLDPHFSTVRYLREGIEINLGAIGKGYALDRCAEFLDAAGIGDYLLHGGNSGVLARGAHAAAPEHGWSIGLRNPLRPEQRLGELYLHNRALATSGSGTQYFEHQGRRYGHILDPRTGWPAEGVLSTTVIAPTAAEADALSTASYVLGPTSAEALCAEHPQYGCLMICPGDKAGTIDIHRFGIAEGDWRAEG